jgi:putative ABC transport system permease protein
MSFYDLFVLSVRTLAKNKLRSLLTILGVVIGIAAVTTMVSIGLGASQLVRTQFQNLGSNVIVVLPAMQQSGSVRQNLVMTLTDADAVAIGEECPSVRAVSPLVGASGLVTTGNLNWQPRDMVGVGADYPLVRVWETASGRFFSDRDVTHATRVCVLGQTVAAKLFPNDDPIDKFIRVKNIPFQVIGVLEAKGANLVGQDQDDILLMPYTTVRQRLQGSAFKNVAFIIVSAQSEERSAQAEQEIRSLLMQRHRIGTGDPPDFEVRNTAEVANVLNIITGTLTAMLSAIAAISLVVGGVGIMNIMLVSVTERTREIGIRMALGARPRDILWQFLVESVVLSSIGGVIGIALGYAASAGITALINWALPSSKWPFVVSFPAALMSMLFAAAVGIFFGFYPARRASKLDPIEALRYD